MGAPFLGDEVQQPSPNSSALRLDFLDRRAGRGPQHGLTALLRGSLGLVGLAGRHDLAVARLQPEPQLARAVVVDLELPGHRVSLATAEVQTITHSTVT